MAVQDVLSALMGSGQAPAPTTPLPTLTPESVKRRRLQAMMQQKEGTSYAPVQHWSQGAARVSQALLGALDEKDMDKQEAAGLASDSALQKEMFGGGAPAAPATAAAPTPVPPTFARTGGQMALDPNLVQNRQFASTDETGAKIDEYLEGNARKQAFNNPVFSNRLLAFLNDNPAGVGVNSLDRDNARQAELWQQAVAKHGSPEEARKWVAPPGSSNHNKGVAADLSYESDQAKAWAHANAQRYGLKFPLQNEAWHVEPAETRGGSPAVPPVAAAAGAPSPVQVASNDPSFMPRMAGAAPTQGDPGNPIPPPQPAPAGQRVAQALSAPPGSPAPGGVVQALSAPAGGASYNVQAAVKALNSGWASEGTKAMARAIIQKSMADPNEREKTLLEVQRLRGEVADQPIRSQGLRLENESKQIQIAKGRAEIEAMPLDREQKKLAIIQLEDNIRNGRASAPLDLAQKEKNLAKSDAPTDVQEFEYGQKTPGFNDWKQGMKKAGAITIDQRSEGALASQQGQGLGKRLNDVADEGAKAQEDAIMYGRFGELLGSVQTGNKTATLEKIRQLTGVALDPNTDNVQALNSAIQYLAPRLRVPGSGSQSDREMGNFLQSIPALANTPGGNEKIMTTLQGLVTYKQQRAEIAQAWQTGDLSAKEATAKINKLQSPFSPPVKIAPDMSPDQVAKEYPSGTRILLPDGTQGVVP